MQKSRNSGVFWLLVLPSISLMFLSLFLSIVIRFPREALWTQWNLHVRAFSLLFALWLLVMFAHNLFDFFILRRYTTLIFNLFSAIVVSFLVAVVYFYFQPDLILTPRRFLLVDLAVNFILLLALYLLVKFIFTRRSPEQIYLFSQDEKQKELANEIRKHSYLGFQLGGYLSGGENLNAVSQNPISIVLPDSLQTQPEMLQKFYELRREQIVFYSHHYFYEQLTRRIDLSAINELWFLEHITYQRKRFYNFFKRLFDLFFGFVMSLIFLLSFPIIAIAIKLSSAGPLFFIQERVGQQGRVFKVYKYRTMILGEGKTWTSENDPRITSIGKFLRRTRLDELPQFINLTLGNMSLVGPRPEQSHIVKMLKDEIPFYDERHWVKPGLTGWAQLNIYASTIEETKQKLQYDLYYIKNQSMFLDLEIIIKTSYHLLAGKGR
jgi:exopolysaccharide biosynthesis polyprenyl glycosylphosphotransferase